MKKTNKKILNIGCGKVLLDGFINIDLDSNADMQLDVTKGLPFENNSIDGIYSEHFIEHITQSQAIAFFRECRRVLKHDGVIRMATPDLDTIINNYTHADWAEKTELDQYGFEWIANTSEFLNIVMREWGHQWLYNETELSRVLNYAGFKNVQRCDINKSKNLKMFNNLETRKDSRLIIESKKISKPISKNSLVSILIPAYNYKYFEISLMSAVQQTYKNIEIIISDDSMGDKIEEITANIAKKYAHRVIKYTKNKKNLGERGNVIECWNNSKGEIIKFLNDDDILMPNSIEKMMTLFQELPDVKLVTSKRDIIDSDGQLQPDNGATRAFTKKTGVINGITVLRTMLNTQTNFIGEPTTTLFRRDDLILEFSDDYHSFAGRHIITNGDVAMWMKLLSQGDLLYIAEPLSQFRVHDEQTQSLDGMQKKGMKAWEEAYFDGKRMGIFEKYYPADWEKPVSKIVPQKVDKIERTDFVSIIIPVFNKIELTRKCLIALEKNTNYADHEIIVVDNASSDGTKEYLAEVEKTNPKIKIITNDENLGFSKANNQAANIAKGKYLLLLNNDTEVEENWLTPLVNIAINDKSVGAVGSKLLFPNRTIQHAGVIFWDDSKSGGDPLVARHIYYQEKESFPEANELRSYRALTAACLLISKKVYDEFDGLDEGFWNGYEDVDLCLKISEAGYKLVYQPKSVVIHHESQSGPERFSKVPENVKRLLNRWGKKNIIDVVNRGKKKFTLTKFHAIQKYVPPTISTNNDVPVVSLIILTYNALKYTKKCVNSIIKHTHYPYEIVFVDNASSDGTIRYLKKIVKKNHNFKLIENKKNKGFSAGNNQGVNIAQGKYIMLLNNDVLVGDGWLTQMVKALELDENIGAVGPITNSISGRQMLNAKSITYKNDGDFFPFSQQVLKQNKDKVTPRRRLAGFSVLMEKTLYQEIDGFDESFGIGNFEDDDLSLRIREKGLALMVAESVYIHHFGSQTFKANNINYKTSLKEKGTHFNKKWPRVDYEELLEMKNPLHELHPKQLALGLEKIELGEYEDAYEILFNLVQEYPLYEEAILNMVMVARVTNHLDEANKGIQRLIRFNPNNAVAYNLAGLMAVDLKNYDHAEKLFKLAMEKDDEFIDAERNLAEAYLLDNNFQEAIDIYVNILKKSPEDVSSLLRMADFNIEAERLEESMTYLEKALEINPDLNEAKKLLRQINRTLKAEGNEECFNLGS